MGVAPTNAQAEASNQWTQVISKVIGCGTAGVFKRDKLSVSSEASNRSKCRYLNSSRKFLSNRNMVWKYDRPMFFFVSRHKNKLDLN